MDATAYWVGFNHVKGIGSVRTRKLINIFGSLEAAWNSSRKELLHNGLSEWIADSIISTRQDLDLSKIWGSIQEKGICVLTWDDAEYPTKLKEIEHPPPVIYFRGTMQPDDEWAVALVGTRRMSVYGRNVTHDIAALLASRKITVVSGMAQGIDSIALHAAVDAGGRTLAVLGCGVDIEYPLENRHLVDEIMANGALISNYPPGTSSDGVKYPPSSRIISGLSQVTIIVEAAETSRALIAAAFAANQGREVFVVNGSILAIQNKGCNKLIREGARIFFNPVEILDILNIENIPEYTQARFLIPEDSVEQTIASILKDEQLPINDIQAVSGSSHDKGCAALVMMELKGMV